MNEFDIPKIDCIPSSFSFALPTLPAEVTRTGTGPFTFSIASSENGTPFVYNI